MACNHFYGSAAHTVCSLGIKVKMEINVTVLYQIKKEIPMLRLIKLVRVHRASTFCTLRADCRSLQEIGL
ncbi:unnamed protein product [Prunus armeniaca]|uniref:Uncharacterized protein n=1 Tax=Prunus armeniaca TaxID=36596 RepID=A0A6J5X6Q0_PRUAR|nr:unnamed protein product [Prunus armeniaca]